MALGSHWPAGAQKHNTRRGRRSGGCRLGDRPQGGGEGRSYSSLPGRRWASTKSLSPIGEDETLFRKQCPPLGGGMRRAPFRWSASGRRRKPTYSSSPGRRSALTKSLSPIGEGETLFRKQCPPLGGGMRRAPFRWSASGRRRKPTYSSSPGRRSALTKSLSPIGEGETLFRKQRPPLGGGVRRAPFRWSTLGRR
jgi:hypothetical protein